MVRIPEEIIEVVRPITEQFQNDAQTAAVEAYRAVREVPKYEEWASLLASEAIAGLVYDLRHSTNIALREREWSKEKLPRVRGVSDCSKEDGRRLLDYYSLRGICLGDLTGEELLSIAADEEEKSRTHQFNAALTRWLVTQGVTGKTKVRDKVSEEKLKRAFRRLRAETSGEKDLPPLMAGD